MFFWPACNPFALADVMRRRQGWMMDALGLGPVETPHQIVLRDSVLTLKRYEISGSKKYDHSGRSDGPVMLIIPAPIKRAYIWDLEPEGSAVRRLLEAGVRVYLSQWERPGPADQDLGLDDYADRFIRECAARIERETGQRKLFLAGHSLGGTLAVIFAALHPGRVAGLVLIESPLHFGPGVGALDRMVAAHPHAARKAASWSVVPGSFLSAAAQSASPTTFILEPMLDRLRSRSDPQARRTHLRVARWAMNETPMPRRLFTEVVEGLYRDDRLARGELEVGGRRLGPRQLHAPALAVIEPHSRLVPPAAMVDFLRAGAGGLELLHYSGDIGAGLQHVGALVGRQAHRHLWPAITAWIHKQSANPQKTKKMAPSQR